MGIILTMIILRPSEAEGLKGKAWLFIYGRRKTGKTFLAENFLDHDEFFFVKRDRTILLKDEWKEYTYDTFIELIRRDLASEKTIVIDEFHRLGEDFLDILHSIGKKGRIILISSTMHTANMLVQKNSPLLGRFSEMNVGLICLGDALNSQVGKKTGMKEIAEISNFMTEPIAIDLIEDRSLYDVIRGFGLTIPALVGEVFSEEDRKLTKTYEALIRAVAVGKNTSGEMSSFIFSRRLSAKDDPSTIQQYLNNLVSFGILKKVPVWRKNRFRYFHTSPIAHTYYYLDERYSIGERKTNSQEIKTYMQEIIPHLMENALRQWMADLFGMSLYLHEAPDFEVDGILSRFKRAEMAFEVKWKERITSSDIMRAETNLERIDAKKKVLIVPDKKELKSTNIKIMDIQDLLKLYNKRLEASHQ